MSVLPALFGVPVDAAYHVVSAVAGVLTPALGGLAAAAAIVTLLSHGLFGTPLGSHWLAGAGPFSAQGAVFAVLFLLLAVAAWLSVRVTRRLAPTPATDPAARTVTAVTRLIPYGTVVIAAFLPLAAGLYLATTTAWTLAERTLLRRPAKPSGATLNTREGR